ncbi:CHASE domain-containing protein [Methyloversatilis thermotolerans]|uniref:CHASE domain-containing protein n=1 Tax=Methyloversatilis thermotolerans TaxID=1346290 RepID=UPI000380A814|nr:CHASE domain-containing protein [Methyloversatilis thermotolerans]
MLAGCLVAWFMVGKRHHERTQERLQFITRDLGQRIEQRMQAYCQILRGARALFDASDEVTEQDWRRYTSALSLQTDFPGIQGVGFALYIPAGQLEVHQASMRRAGYADYVVRPPSVRDEYSSIVFLEPMDWRNQRAFAFDMMSEPVRREAMHRARDSGEPALSGRVVLVQETEHDIQSGVLLYLPSYHPGMATDTVEQRRAALRGWVYSPFRMKDLMRGTLGDHLDGVRLRIFDGEEARPERLIFDSHDGDPVRFDAPSHTQSIGMEGRRWRLLVEQREEAASDIDLWYTELALVGLFGALALTLATGLGNARLNNARLAELGASLAASNRLYSTLVNLSGEGILSLDEQGRIEFVNPGLQRMLTRSASDIEGLSLDELAAANGRHAAASMAAALMAGESVRMELTLDGRARGEVTVLASGVSRSNEAGQAAGAIIVMADISDRKADEARIAWLATHDGLTGLPNRALLADRLNRTLVTARRYGRSFCLMFIDLDHFKAVNDRLGHGAGDALLVEATRRMQGCLRAADTLARYGGDEFVALLPETRSVDAARAVAEKIRARLGEPFLTRDGTAHISASVGITLCPDDGDDVDTLVGRADCAMYAAKADGRNTIAVWNASAMDER